MLRSRGYEMCLRNSKIFFESVSISINTNHLIKNQNFTLIVFTQHENTNSKDDFVKFLLKNRF